MLAKSLILSTFALTALAFPYRNPPNQERKEPQHAPPSKPTPASSHKHPLTSKVSYTITYPTNYPAVPPPLPKLPDCDATAPEPCQCPPGTFFQESTSYVFYEAPAKELVRITGNFLEPDWFGTHPAAVSGIANIPGATRTLMGGLPFTNDLFPLIEELTLWEPYPNNEGYFMRFRMADDPFFYNTTRGLGIIGGTWEYMDVRAVSPTKTFFVWNLHACFSDVFDFKAFHISAMNNLTDILTKEHKLRGPTIGPFSF